MKMTICFLFLGIWSMTLFATTRHVHAALGESILSVEKDREALSAVPGASEIRKGYTVQELDSDSTTIREYVSGSGVIFAVAWNGLVRPDLTQLLGSYASEYQRTLEETPREPGRRRFLVKTNDVVVEQWGHMRNLQGRAYVPALIPPGVEIDEIK